ncbi:ATP-binding cassette domain-containing protein [Actinomadura logoneensis]|uniref:ATP-binding cassette domain-containing protein n=1 Tax=Actinomadura logoneensis TaxID=2293572 RepID=A0A372JEL6_9ACTN|nr:ATP-binding cassette domain-containing protein [Actinomadura logoneensis]RFU38463.1 ATP-binding cassette domain-containing protein [Actinomadura logoneensis]
MEAVLAADGLGVRTRRGPVFSGVTVRAAPGEVLAVSGPGGSGRTSLLLTLAGRMRPADGALVVAGASAPAGIRARVGVARVTGAAEPEPGLRVRQHVGERRLSLRDPGDFADARKVVGLDAADHELVRDLPDAETTRLALALALLDDVPVIVLDDLDRGADAAEQVALWAAARRAADTGPAVVATVLEPSPAHGLADRHVLLGGGA